MRSAAFFAATWLVVTSSSLLLLLSMPSATLASARKAAAGKPGQQASKFHNPCPFLVQRAYESNGAVPKSFETKSFYWTSIDYLANGAFTPSSCCNNNDAATSEVGGIDLFTRDAVTQRIVIRGSASLKDAAVWSMALAAAGAYKLVRAYEYSALYPSMWWSGWPARSNGQDEMQPSPKRSHQMRAYTAAWTYGSTPGPDLKPVKLPANVTRTTGNSPASHTVPGAFFHDVLVPRVFATDDLLGQFGPAFAEPYPDEDGSSDNIRYNMFGRIVVSENDFPTRATVGANALAAILAPLQSLRYATNGSLMNTTCYNPMVRRNGGQSTSAPPVACDFMTWDTTPPPVQLAITVLPAFLELQLQNGAITQPTLKPGASGGGSSGEGAEEDIAAQPSADGAAQISIADNMIALSALSALTHVLETYTLGTSDPLLQWALNSAAKLHKGLKTFLSDPQNLLGTFTPPGSSNSTMFVFADGTYNASGFTPRPLSSAYGVSTESQIMALAILGTSLDDLLGDLTAFKLWQAVKTYLMPSARCVGMLPTDAQPNSKTACSCVWSMQAVIAANSLSAAYAAAGKASVAQSLSNDAQELLNGAEMTFLCYNGAPNCLFATEPFYSPAVTDWNGIALPIPSTGANGWFELASHDVNPFAW